MLSLDDDEFQGPIKIKLSRDGNNIRRNYKLINFTFTILNETFKAKTSSGNYTIGISNLEETYDDLKPPIQFITSEISELDHIAWKNKAIKIEYFFCSDWKLTATVLGLYAASSNNPCIWCTASKSDFHKIEKKFSLEDPNFFCRTKSQHEEILNKNSKIHLGYKQPNLLVNFDYKKCVIDTLHMFLRISDALISLLVKKICSHDNICNKTKIDFSKHLYVAKYFDVLKNRCKIRVDVYSSVKDGDSITRDLTGPEKIRLFRKIQIADYFKEIQKTQLKIFVK